MRSGDLKFEGALRGVDARILVAQVPGGMLTNLESQLKEQGASDRLDAVLADIPRVRQELGYIPLVTPTSQIVGTQAVLNVLAGERYKSIAAETAGILKGTYGATPAPVDEALRARVLKPGEAPVLCRPADLLEPELERLGTELAGISRDKGIRLAEARVDDTLTYALFPQVGLKFLANRANPDAFEPPPWEPCPPAAEAPAASVPQASGQVSEEYLVEVSGRSYRVKVSPAGTLGALVPAGPALAPPAAPRSGQPVPSPLAGTILEVKVTQGQAVAAGDLLLTLEAMKMETEIRSPRSGVVVKILVQKGTAVTVGQPLVSLG